MWIVDRILTWWRGQTLNTQVWTALYGERVGEDDRRRLSLAAQAHRALEPSGRDWLHPHFRPLHRMPACT